MDTNAFQQPSAWHAEAWKHNRPTRREATTIRHIIDWSMFFVLLAASVMVTPLVLPYTLALSPSFAKTFTPTILVAQIVQAVLLFSVAIFVGLLLGERVGLGLPILEGMLKGKRQSVYLKSILGLSIGMGILGALFVILLSLLFLPLSVSLLEAEMSVATWKAFLASFYGGIAEEVFLSSCQLSCSVSVI